MEIGFIIIIGFWSCIKSTLHAYYENTCVDYEQSSIWLSWDIYQPLWRHSCELLFSVFCKRDTLKPRWKNRYVMVNNPGFNHWTTFEKINYSKIKARILSSCFILAIWWVYLNFWRFFAKSINNDPRYGLSKQQKWRFLVKFEVP